MSDELRDKLDALLPCPLCGGEARFEDSKGPTGELYAWVECVQCGAMSSCGDIRSAQPEEVHPIDAWNTRAKQPVDEPVHADQITAPGRYMAPVDALGEAEVLIRAILPIARKHFMEEAAGIAEMHRESEQGEVWFKGWNAACEHLSELFRDIDKQMPEPVRASDQ